MAGKGGGGAWKVAYADFVTAMMAFFLVMWITAQSPKVKESVATYFENPPEAAGRPKAGRSKGRKMTVSTGPFQAGQSSGSALAMGDRDADAPPNPKGVAATKPPRMVIYRDNSKSRTSGTIIKFPDGSAELGDEGLARLQKIAPQLERLCTKIEIRSHLPRRTLPATDSPHGEIWQFSHARCLAVMRFLQRQEGERLAVHRWIARRARRT